MNPMGDPEPDPAGGEIREDSERLRAVVRWFASGLLMGLADTIPGVSGGTVAMVLRIYDRLVTAISRIDTTLVMLVVRGRWREAAGRIELGFLLPLALGIVSGILVLASLMRVLLRDYPSQINAIFFGLVAGSCLVVVRGIGGWTKLRVALMAVAMVSAFVVVGFPTDSLEPSGDPMTLFVIGSIAICAMILPGVSGAFLLKMMGRYDTIIGLLSDLVQGRATTESLFTLAVFACGCLFGLITFSKLLKVLLSRTREATLAVLCGAMCGSLRVLWPLGGEGGEGQELGTTMSLVLLMTTGLVVVLVLDRFSRRSDREFSEDGEQQQSAGSD